MSIWEHASTLGGQKVVGYDAKAGIGDRGVAYRLDISWDERESATATLAGKLAAFAADPKAGDVEGLVIGDWGGAAEGDGADAAIAALAGAAGSLGGLRRIFFGDLIAEEAEISWIMQGDVTPLLTAYPKLEELRVRGSGTAMSAVTHAALKTLVFESGGLPAGIVEAVTASTLPALEHLELWLGTDEYGWNGSMSTVAALIDADRFEALRYLGLRNSILSDAIAKHLCGSAMLNRIRVLDLSLGTLSMAGIETLVGCHGVTQLERLDVHHHYGGSEGVELLGTLGIEVNSDVGDADEYDEDDDYRYVCHSE